MNKFKLFLDLQDWIELGIQQDIVDCPEHRPGYAEYIEKAKAAKVATKKIPYEVLSQLKQELIQENEPKTFWQQVKSCFKK